VGGGGRKGIRIAFILLISLRVGSSVARATDEKMKITAIANRITLFMACTSFDIMPCYDR
jgi:hypothetical protein